MKQSDGIYMKLKVSDEDGGIVIATGYRNGEFGKYYGRCQT
jgi:hypothetical protein